MGFKKDTIERLEILKSSFWELHRRVDELESRNQMFVYCLKDIGFELVVEMVSPGLDQGYLIRSIGNGYHEFLRKKKT